MTVRPRLRRRVARAQHRPLPGLRLGLDAGGTATRAVLIDEDGAVLGRAGAGGGNPGPHGPALAVTEISRAITAALSVAGASPHHVGACTIALSGYRGLGSDQARQEFARRCRAAAGLTVPVLLVHDAVAAFASAQSGLRGGSVLIAGTGAVACRISADEVVATAGGLGWLLGDEGSGHWLGREAAKAAHWQLTARGAAGLGVLARAVLAEAAPRTENPDALLAALYARPPATLSLLAPLVSHAAEAGDPVARLITRNAAEHLTELVIEVRESDEADENSAPVVLAGSVLTTPGPIRTAVTELLARRLGAAPILAAADAALAAARLAGKHRETG